MKKMADSLHSDILSNLLLHSSLTKIAAFNKNTRHGRLFGKRIYRGCVWGGEGGRKGREGKEGQMVDHLYTAHYLIK